MSLRAVAALALVLLAGPAGTGQRPLPDLDAFLPEVRARLQTDAQRQYGYAYIETRHRARLSADGEPTDESVIVVESSPSFPGEPRWERVIERDGGRVSDEELREQDEERERRTKEYLRKMARQTDADRAKQERDWEEQRRELTDTLDDVFRVYQIVMLGRERVAGHETIVFSLTPRSDAEVVSDDGKLLRHFEGRAWISESDYELVRLDVEAIDDMSVAMGLLARVHKGTRVSFERRKVNGEAWLPVTSSYTMSVRVMLVRLIRERVTSEFSDYQEAETLVTR